MRAVEIVKMVGGVDIVGCKRGGTCRDSEEVGKRVEIVRKWVRG